jgi:hypothetical protein
MGCLTVKFEMLMRSTPLAYPRVLSRRLALFCVVRFCVSAAQRDFCAWFDSRQLHNRICKEHAGQGVFLRWPVSFVGTFLGTFFRRPGHQVVHLFGNVVKVIGEQVPVLIERHRRRLVPELSLHRLDVGTPWRSATTPPCGVARERSPEGTSHRRACCCTWPHTPTSANA